MANDDFGPPASPREDDFGVPGTLTSGHDYVPAEGRAGVQMALDQWNRYRIPSADGVQPAANKGRTRVSTIAKVGSDETLLQDRAERLIVAGLGANPALNAQAMKAAAMSEGKAQKAELRRVAALAFEAAGGNEKRDRGTAFHELTDAINRGQDVTIPDELKPEIDAYYEALEKYDLQVIPKLMERVVLCPYDTGGAFDNIMRRWNPDTESYELVIVDLKTGQTLEFSWLSFLIQLWMYANAYFMYVTDDLVTDDKGKVISVRGHIEEMPLELRRDRAILIRCPLDGTAEVLELDLSGVDRYAAASVELKRGNAEAKYKYRSLGVVRPAAFTTPSIVTPEGFQDQVTGTVTPFAKGAQVKTDTDPTDHIVLHSPPGPVPTTDQLTQQAKAVERLAKVTNIGSVVDKQTAPTHDPVTGRKKRTCGHCHKPGHTQKNCPDNPASAKYNPYPHAGGSALVEPATPGAVDSPGQQWAEGGGQPEPTRVTSPEGTYGPNGPDGPWDPEAQAQGYSIAQDPPEPVLVPTGEPYDAMVISPEGPPPRDVEQAKTDALLNAPYCVPNVVHPKTGACQWTASGSQWVCSISGKPGKVAWEKGRTTVTAEHPHYGMPDGEGTLPSQGAEATAQSQVAAGQPVTVEWPTAPADPQWATQPPDMVAWGISNAETASDVLQHRTACLAARTWNDDYDVKAQLKYRELMAAGKP